MASTTFPSGPKQTDYWQNMGSKQRDPAGGSYFSLLNFVKDNILVPMGLLSPEPPPLAAPIMPPTRSYPTMLPTDSPLPTAKMAISLGAAWETVLPTVMLLVILYVLLKSRKSPAAKEDLSWAALGSFALLFRIRFLFDRSVASALFYSMTETIEQDWGWVHELKVTCLPAVACACLLLVSLVGLWDRFWVMLDNQAQSKVYLFHHGVYSTFWGTSCILSAERLLPGISSAFNSTREEVYTMVIEIPMGLWHRGLRVQDVPFVAPVFLLASTITYLAYVLIQKQCQPASHGPSSQQSQDVQYGQQLGHSINRIPGKELSLATGTENGKGGADIEDPPEADIDEFSWNSYAAAASREGNSEAERPTSPPVKPPGTDAATASQEGNSEAERPTSPPVKPPGTDAATASRQGNFEAHSPASPSADGNAVPPKPLPTEAAPKEDPSAANASDNDRGFEGATLTSEITEKKKKRRRKRGGAGRPKRGVVPDSTNGADGGAEDEVEDGPSTSGA